MAWFARPKIDTSFNASVVKSYFDADSVINIGADGKLNDCVFIITKPVHLYNLAYLTDKGIFNERTTFQLGKPRLGDSTLGDASAPSRGGGEYFAYKKNTDNEKSDFNLTEKVIDMSAYTKYGGIPPIGVSGANTEFCHTFRGNGITIANCSVTDKALLDGKRAYFPHVGLFGTVTDGANVSNFNVLNLTINSTKENPGASLGGSGAVGEKYACLWINLEYEESLVREFCAVTGLNYGELTSSAIGSTIPLSADLKFTFYAAAGDHGAQNSDVL